ncbi:MAG: hypothetical protein GC164_02540 [Phycisphaera sp.]|nr:hypothetical protein [Phycisphaera sp.]
MVDLHASAVLLVFDDDAGLLSRLVFMLRCRWWPGRIGCPLSRLIRAPLGLSTRWRELAVGLKVRVRTLYRDEFRIEHEGQARVRLPAVFVEHPDGSVELLMDDRAIALCSSVASLVDQIANRLHPPADPMTQGQKKPVLRVPGARRPTV